MGNVNFYENLVRGDCASSTCSEDDLILESQQSMNECHEVSAQLVETLSRISYEKLDIPDELKIPRYERAEDGTCPKTQQMLPNTVFTSKNDVLSLIAQWCEANGFEPPKKVGSSKVETLVRKLTSSNVDVQRIATRELRHLAKENVESRVCIAEGGAVPILVDLLSTSDLLIQEYAVTTLFYLSICEDTKDTIIFLEAVHGIVHVLKKGNIQARENAAATLFSLSAVDENKVIIGNSGAIPSLATLLREGSHLGKKGAAIALFSLCKYEGNRGRAIRAGVVPILMRLLTEPGGRLVDEALAILAILSSHPEGNIATGIAETVLVMVEMISGGSPRYKENFAAVLGHSCPGDQQYMTDAQELGVMGPLFEMSQNGTEYGKWRARQLLEQMNRFMEQHKQSQVQIETHPYSAEL